MKVLLSGVGLSVVLSLLSCADTGRERVEVPLAGSGTAARELSVGAARITLTRADVAFGPAYFCASEAGRAELCEVALAELRTAVPIRALDPAPQPLGALSAVTGEVRSGLYDYGISWLITEAQPRAHASAPAGHSAVLEGTLTQAGRSVRFRADVDVKARTRGDAALNGQRSRYVVGERTRLTLQVDANAWVDRLDGSALLALDVDGDGFVAIPADSPLYESIVQGMVSRAPVRFDWRDDAI